MNTIGSAPHTEQHSSSVRLEIDFGEQRELAHQLKKLGDDLKEQPLAIPDRNNVSLRGVGLRVNAQRGKAQSYMSLDIAEQINRRPSATIRITDPTPQRSAAYGFLPEFDVWEEWRAGMTEPARMVSNTDLIELLDGQLPIERVFEPLSDKIPTGLEVAHILADNIKKSARTRTQKRQYSDTQVIIGAPDYMGGVETNFTVNVVNGRTRHSLFVAASQLTGIGTIEKQYGYEALFSTRTLQDAGGMVRLSSVDDISPIRLDAFARRDQQRNYPIDSLSKGIDRLRKAYKI